VEAELLFFDGCPGAERLIPRLRELARDGGAELVLRRVESSQDAVDVRFLGSPSVRVDGRDVEPGADARDDFGLKCRLYRSPDGDSHAPREDWIRQAMGIAHGG